MTAIFFTLATFFSTIFGGITALRNQRYLNRIMGFTAGVLLGVVTFELLPIINEETFVTKTSFLRPMVALVIGFLLFHILEKTILLHHAVESEYEPHVHPRVGLASALALCGHSFLDGMAIGLGFEAGPSVGIAVAIAVIAHDFTDGINTVVLMLKNKNSTKRAKILLVIDAIAPIAGVLSTRYFYLKPEDQILYLGFFAGFLLYIGASDILPQAHSKHSSKITVALTVLGAAFMYAVARFA